MEDYCMSQREVVECVKETQKYPAPPLPKPERAFPMFRQLAAGDILFFPNMTGKELSQTLVYYRRRYAMKLVSRTEDGGTRVWRLEDE
jgi:hypothetical protein